MTTTEPSLGEPRDADASQVPSERRRLVHASAWTVLGLGVNLGCGLLASIVLARILGVVQFGAYSMIRATMLTATTVAVSGLPSGLAKVIAEFATTSPRRAGRAFALLLATGAAVSGSAAAITFAFASLIAKELGAAHLFPAVLWAAPSVFFAGVTALQIGALNGLEAPKQAASLSALDGMVTTLLVITGVAVAPRFVVASAAMMAASFITCLAGWILLRRASHRRGIVLDHRGARSEAALLRQIVLPSLILGLSSQPFALWARTLLSRGGGLADVGVFAAALSWSGAVMTIPSQLQRHATPVLSRLRASERGSEYGRLLRDTTLLSVLSSSLVGLPLMIAAPWVMRAHGRGFEHGAPVLILLVLSSIIGSVALAQRSALTAAGKLWEQVLHAIIWGGTLVGSFILLRAHAALGLAAAYVAAFAVASVTQYLANRKSPASVPPASVPIDESESPYPIEPTL